MHLSVTQWPLLKVSAAWIMIAADSLIPRLQEAADHISFRHLRRENSTPDLFDHSAFRKNCHYATAKCSLEWAANGYWVRFISLISCAYATFELYFVEIENKSYSQLLAALSVELRDADSYLADVPDEIIDFRRRACLPFIFLIFLSHSHSMSSRFIHIFVGFNSYFVGQCA